MAVIKLLLVDDHGPLRKALREGLQATGAVQVLGEPVVNLAWVKSVMKTSTGYASSEARAIPVEQSSAAESNVPPTELLYSVKLPVAPILKRS